VLTWPDAHRVAAIAAAQAHHEFGLDVDRPPMDVAAAIAAAGLPLIWRPMSRLFGAYVTGPGLRPGVLVTSAVPVGARRHTAAHELGHHQLGHTSAVDDGSCLQIDSPDDHAGAPLPGRPARWSDAEKAAEAFAAWFLMPRRAVDAALGRLGIARVDSPADVYRLSLQLGTSYRSTARHLPNLRRATPAQSRLWMRQPPGRIKAGIDPTRTWHGRGAADIWTVDQRFAGAKLDLQQGDQLVVWHPAQAALSVSGAECLGEPTAGTSGQLSRDPGKPSPGKPGKPGDTGDVTAWTTWTATAWPDRGDRTATVTIDTLPGGQLWSVDVTVHAQPAGLDTHWLERMETPA
jgi:hypothetical protein